MADVELLPIVLLLGFSPIIGYIILRLFYADIRMHVPAERWILSLIVGFAPFVPAVVAGFLWFAAPNTTYFFVVYAASLLLDGAVVTYIRDKREARVGMPKDAIKYTLQIHRAKEGNSPEARAKRIEMLTAELEKSLPSKDRDVKKKMELLKESLKKEKEDKKKKEKTEKLLKDMRKKIETSKKTPSEKPEVRIEDVEKDERADKLLKMLEKEVEQQKPLTEEEIFEGDEIGKEVVEKLTESLKEGRRWEEKEHLERKKIGKEPEVWKEELVKQASKATSRRAAHGPEDIIRSMVDDVRTQLVLFKRKEEVKSEKTQKAPKKKWWYDESKAAKEKTSETSTALGGEEKPKEQTTGEELFESDLDFGKLGGEEDELTKGLEEEFGSEALGDLGTDDLTELKEGGYDGMMVSVGNATPSSCPRCTKKGTTIVFCPSCAHPFCSNCAKSVTAQKDSIGYTCPDCGNIFAVKRHD